MIARRSFSLARVSLSFTAASVLAVGCPSTTEDPPVDADNGFSCDGDLCTVTGPILKDATFTKDKKWVLVGGVFVGDDADPTASPATLTIEPGTTVFGDTATLSFLLITRGSKINAVGTAAEPIVFTSAADVGERAAGQWGGIVINGQAPVNGCAGDPCTLTGEAGTGTYGGNIANDNSGSVQFVRVEFPGKLVDDENELNGIALQGVGSGTTLDHIQVHKGADDCIEFFGGTANAKHVLCTGAGDDNLDWTFGWTGKVQFLIAQQHDDAGERGIEADNNEDNHELTPVSRPVVSNITLIGGDASKDGMKLRRGTHGEIRNAVVVDFGSDCVDIDDAATFTGVEDGNLVIETSFFDCDQIAKVAEDDPETADENEADPFDVNTIFGADAAGNDTGDAEIVDAHNLSAPNFKLATTSPARTGGSVPADAFFDDVSFRGAVGDDDWTTGWTAYPAN